MKKTIAGFLFAVMLATVGVACSDGMNQAACASGITLIKPSPPAPKPSGGGSKTPSGGSKTPSGGSKTPKPSPPKTGSKANPSSAPKPKVSSSGTGAARKTTATPPGEKAYTPPSPKAAPAPADAAKVKATAPKSYTTSGGYTSPVTNHYYVYHQPDYFFTASYLAALDLYDPYDPFNHYYRPLSPFYGQPYYVGSDCGQQGDEYKPSQADYDTVSTKGDMVSAKLDAGQTDGLDALDADGAVVPTTTSTTLPGTTTTVAPTTSTTTP